MKTEIIKSAIWGFTFTVCWIIGAWAGGYSKSIAQDYYIDDLQNQIQTLTEELHACENNKL